MNERLVDILFCLVMFSECLYLWYVREQIDDLVEDLRDLLHEGCFLNKK